jgi:hypothetical protein
VAPDESEFRLCSALELLRPTRRNRIAQSLLVQAMRARYPQSEENTVTIALYFVACTCVCGLLVLGFCAMFETRHIPNLGVAAYKPFPATVVQYSAGNNKYAVAAVPIDEAADAMTGRAAQPVELIAPVAPVAAPARTEGAVEPASEQTARARRTAMKSRETRLQHAERNASSRAQVQARSLAAAFPGYAVLH